MVKVDRLETLVQRVVADVIQNEVKEPMGFVTITGVKMTNEFSFMYVYYTVFGDENVIEKTKKALDHANGYIKNQIAARVKMRKVPELIFKIDESYNTGKKVDDIIRTIK